MYMFFTCYPYPFLIGFPFPSKYISRSFCSARAQYNENLILPRVRHHGRDSENSRFAKLDSCLICDRHGSSRAGHFILLFGAGVRVPPRAT